MLTLDTGEGPDLILERIPSYPEDAIRGVLLPGATQDPSVDTLLDKWGLPCASCVEIPSGCMDTLWPTCEGIRTLWPKKASQLPTARNAFDERGDACLDGFNGEFEDLRTCGACSRTLLLEKALALPTVRNVLIVLAESDPLLGDNEETEGLWSGRVSARITFRDSFDEGGGVSRQPLAT